MRCGTPGQAPRFSFVLLGFVTLAAQSLLLREFFSVLHGSDLAFGFALAAWTVLTAAGALVAARQASRPRGAARWGAAAYVALAGGVLLAVRAWGAQEVIPFHAYLLIPAFLAPLCLLGGMLFPWFLGDLERVSTAEAYALEVAGGLAAGIVCALEFHLGALDCPLLLGLLAISAAWGYAMARPPGGTALLVLALGAGLLLPLLPPGQWIERLALRLRVREWAIVEAVNTPFSALVAARDPTGHVVLFENGTPWPIPEATHGRAAVAAALWALPERCERALFVHALRAGFGAVLQQPPTQVPPRLLETDLRAQAFVQRHLGGTVAPATRATRFSLAALRPAEAGWDLVAVMGSAPEGLVANLPLTTEFARSVVPCLAPGGVLAIALPAAPGFTHPEQEAYLATVRRSLHDACPAVCELRTEVGWTLLVASSATLDRRAAAGRIGERSPWVPPGALAEAGTVLRGEGILSIEAVAAGHAGEAALGDEAPAPPNRVGSPRGYFRFLQFRGALVEDAPGWWRLLFRERTWVWSAVPVAVLLAAGLVCRRGRAVQGIFWAAWSATVALIAAVYLYQSLAGQAFWALSLISAASMVGILAGTRLRRCRPAEWVSPAMAAIPAALFPLYPVLEGAPAPVVLGTVMAAVAAAGAGLGYVFARRCAPGQGAVAGGRLFAVDLLGAGAGLFLGGVLLPWWSGFATAVAVGAAAATVGVAVEIVCTQR